MIIIYKIKYYQKVEELNLYMIHMVMPVGVEEITLRIEDLKPNIINNIYPRIARREKNDTTV